jgi:serine phosphatase RsbU (regulator of sigma subunit)
MLIGAALSANGRSLSPRRLNILDGIAQQAATAVINNRLYQEAAERDRMEQELNVARDIQTSLIPDGSPDIPGCNTASFWEAARQVSGDFYDFLPLRNGRWGIVIADVADKGVPAALFMALSRTILRTVALNRESPADVLMRVNEILDNDAQSDLFVTIFYAIWDPTHSRLTYANGGHNPPLLIRANGNTELLPNSGMALGVLPTIQVRQHSLTLHAGDTLVCYTDGITEAMNEDLDEFGMKRLHLAANRARHANASAIIEAITQDVTDHAGDSPQFDDMTLLVLKREGEGETAVRPIPKINRPI